jgi:tRNA-specific 2-thiouridylase
LGVAFGEPRFVVRIDPDSNDVVLGPRSALACTRLSAQEANWLTAPPSSPFDALAQIRYNSSAVPAKIFPTSKTTFEVEFAEAASGVAPGQLCVVYDQDRVLGGGWID